MIDNRFFLGRQPIVGRGQELVAYELLFRSSASNAANILDDVTASAAVIQHVFSDLGVQQALGEHRGYINFSEELLLSDLIEVLPPDRVVLEILETVSLTPEVIAPLPVTILNVDPVGVAMMSPSQTYSVTR